MKKYIAVFDETGTSNRPQSTEESGFGVGAVLFPLEQAPELARISKHLGSIVGKEDYKYKDVLQNEAARELFIQTLNRTSLSIHLFAFYAHGACMIHEGRRTKDAALAYGREYKERSSPRGERFVPFDSFIAYMASCIAAHAATNEYAVDIYWDRRTDLDQLKASFDEHIARQSDTQRYRNVAELVSFKGRAQNDLALITRLAGVLAGDVWRYFESHGPKIWTALDVTGLPGEYDPHMTIDDPDVTGPPCVAVFMERLIKVEPVRTSATSMLQGYYKRFLKNENKENLISFGDPHGRLGIIGIVNGHHWKIYQLPD